MKYKFIISVIFVSALFLFSCDVLNIFASNEDFIKREVEKMEKELPIEIDEYTTWSDVEAGVNQVHFIYDINGIDADSVDDNMISEAKSKIISGLKSQANLRHIFKRDISIKYSFYDEDEYEIMELTVSRHDLGL